MFNEPFYRLALQYQENLGNQSIKKLIREFGSAMEIFRQPAKQLHLKGMPRNVPPLAVTSAMRDKIERELEYMTRFNVECCFYTDECYPKRLKNCTDAPYLFYYQGNNDFDRAKMLSVVGTRSMNSYGRDAVKKLVSELAPYNVSIVSGLAFGVDAAAHELALDYGLHTIAVMGSGFGHIYPAINRKLAARIVECGGALISEFPYDTLPDRTNFPQRNRIIAGMSDATLVAESARKGGSIITAFIANSYNRDVFAVPGSLFDPSYEGCHELIHTNIAAIACSGSHLADMMGWTEQGTKAVQTSLFVTLNEEEELLMNFIRETGQRSIDEIVTNCPNFTPSRIASILLGLELRGVVACLPGKIYRC
ncbi:MAG: DNA-processing protein DprA [Bacteroidales bacterium]|jgi:DNA processing protein|nr:DNA-processing protein DprA [Bacteroidales bacterium]